MSCESFSNSQAILIHVWRRMWCHKTVRWVSVLNDRIPPPQHFTGSGPFFTLTSESAGLGSVAVKRNVASQLNYTYCMSVQLPAWIFIARGRTVLCWCSRWPLPRHLKRHFLLTHKEELMDSFLCPWVWGHAEPLNWLFLFGSLPLEKKVLCE